MPAIIIPPRARLIQVSIGARKVITVIRPPAAAPIVRVSRSSQA
jgi:hypothetical protein